MNANDFIEVDNSGGFVRVIPREELLEMLGNRRDNVRLNGSNNTNVGAVTVTHMGGATSIEGLTEVVALLTSKDALVMRNLIGLIDEQPQLYRPVFNAIASNSDLLSLDMTLSSPAALNLLKDSFQEKRHHLLNLTCTVTHHDALGMDYKSAFESLRYTGDYARITVQNRNENVITQILSGIVASSTLHIDLSLDWIANSHTSFLQRSNLVDNRRPAISSLRIGRLVNPKWQSIVDLFGIKGIKSLAISKSAMPNDSVSDRSRNLLQSTLNDKIRQATFRRNLSLEVPSWLAEAVLMGLSQQNQTSEKNDFDWDYNTCHLYLPDGTDEEFDSLCAYLPQAHYLESLTIPYRPDKLDLLHSAISQCETLQKLELRRDWSSPNALEPLPDRFGALLQRNKFIKNFQNFCTRHHYNDDQHKHTIAKHNILHDKKSALRIVQEFDRVNRESQTWDGIKDIDYHTGLTAKYLMVQKMLTPLLFVNQHFEKATIQHDE